MSETRVFFVTDSKEENEEIFDTLEAAQAHYLSAMNTGTGRRIRICIVRNAYLEDHQEGQGWNYDDQADTFEPVYTVQEEANQ